MKGEKTKKGTKRIPSWNSDGSGGREGDHFLNDVPDYSSQVLVFTDLTTDDISAGSLNGRDDGINAEILCEGRTAVDGLPVIINRREGLVSPLESGVNKINAMVGEFDDI